MKKISNEVKIGFTALITILVFIWLFNFLKGKNLFSKTANYYVVYDKVGGLAESSPVEINGYKVGVVQSVRFLDPLSGRLLVELSVEKGFQASCKYCCGNNNSIPDRRNEDTVRVWRWPGNLFKRRYNSRKTCRINHLKG